MFKNLREEIEAVCQEADQLLERDEWRRAQQARQSAPAEIIRKTYEPRPAPQQQQSAPAMDSATQEAWNRWLADYVTLALEANNKATEDAIVEFVCEYVHKHLKTVREENCFAARRFYSSNRNSTR